MDRLVHSAGNIDVLEPAAPEVEKNFDLGIKEPHRSVIFKDSLNRGHLNVCAETEC